MRVTELEFEGTFYDGTSPATQREAGVSYEELTAEDDYSAAHRLARDAGANAVMLPSVPCPGEANLVVFNEAVEGCLRPLGDPDIEPL